MQTVIVTGGAGFIGAHLSGRLSRQGYHTIVVDDLSQGKLQNLNYAEADVEFIQGDISDPEFVRYLFGSAAVDVVYHLAGQANVPQSVRDPRNDFRINALGTQNILEIARSANVRRIVFTSSAAIYSPNAILPITEASPTQASSPYGASKAAAENYCFAYAATYGIDVVVLRLFNVFGPLMSKYVIHDIVRKLLADPHTLTLLGDGKQIRDYLYVADAVNAMLLVAEKAAPGQVYNLGSGHPTTINNLAIDICKKMSLTDVKFQYTGETWPGDIAAWYADTSKLAQLGYAPQVSFDVGLAQTIEYLAHY